MKKRILLAEDDPLTRACMDEFLYFLGCDVVSVADGEAALERARADRFDIIIMAHDLPLRGGPDVVRELRTDKHGARICILSGALTATELDQYKEMNVTVIGMKALELQALHDLLFKRPINPSSGRIYA